MKLIALIAFALSSSAAIACPNLAGKYLFSEHPLNGLIIQQYACDSATLTFIRPVTPSATYPDGVWTFAETHKVDGKAYKWYYDSKELADQDSDHSNSAVYDGDRFVLTFYDGARRDCAEYKFNAKACHKEDFSLERTEAGSYEWHQTGGYWSENGGYEQSVFPLVKQN